MASSNAQTPLHLRANLGTHANLSIQAKPGKYPRAILPRSAIPVQQAVLQAPTLARLAAVASDSKSRLDSLNDLLPSALRAGVQAGPVEEDQWCLLAANSAVAAKLRQLGPVLLAHLRTQGWQVNAIRIKVQGR